MTGTEALFAHFESGITTTCRAWALKRRDGRVLGFTDHDLDLTFEGLTFLAGTGLSAANLQQTTGLSVDNSEASGALSDAAVTEEDVLAGRYDEAEVTAWIVNWAAPDERVMTFRGSLGEITRAGGAFQAELRGMTEALNRPQGRVIQSACTAVLGDSACRFDLTQAGYFTVRVVESVEEARVLRFANFAGFEDRWFERGRLVVVAGAAKGVVVQVKNDRQVGAGRQVDLWEPVGPTLVAGDLVRIEAGCDKRAETCRLKFANFLNFRGFPHVPGEDWLTSYPQRNRSNTGGSLGR